MRYFLAVLAVLVGCSGDPAASTADGGGGQGGGAGGAPADGGDDSTTVAVCDPADPSLVACWDFDGLDPLADRSRNGRDLIAPHPAAVVDGRRGKAVAGAATSEVAGVSPTREMTLEAWIKFTAKDSPGHILGSNPGWTWSFAEMAFLQGRKAPMWWVRENAPIGTWHHVALAMSQEAPDGSTQAWRRCFDGVCEDFAGSEGLPRTERTEAGGVGVCSAGMECDDLRIYSRKLSAAEIAAHAR